MNVRKRIGTRNNVKIVATNKPDTMLVAIGPQRSDLPPSPTASENKPAIVVIVVIKIGITRRLAAYIVACKGRIPFAIRVFAASMRTIAAFTAIPVRATIP